MVHFRDKSTIPIGMGGYACDIKSWYSVYPIPPVQSKSASLALVDYNIKIISGALYIHTECSCAPTESFHDLHNATVPTKPPSYVSETLVSITYVSIVVLWGGIQWFP